MLRVYGHRVSQPTRAVLWALDMKQVPYEFRKLDPTAGEAESDEYLKKFPFGFVPAIEEGTGAGFRLQESGPILCYLAEKHQWDDLYPKKDPARRAKINEWMSWQATTLRPVTTEGFFRPAIRAWLGKFPAEKVPEMHAKATKAIRASMLSIKYNAFFDGASNQVRRPGGEQQRYLLEGDAPTLADIAVYCELDQLRAMGVYEPRAADPAFECVSQWMDEMEKLPCHDDVRRTMMKAMAQIKADLAKNPHFKR